MGFQRGESSLASRYRSLILLAMVLVAQLLLLAYQLRRDQDIPMVRYGTVLVVTPIQKGLRAVLDGVQGVWYGYMNLRGARRESEALTQKLDELKLENHRLREQADQARRLQVLFGLREEVPSPTVVARVISASSSETARMLTIDKGRNDGLEPDLPVLVPDGVVGKVLHVFPNAAQVLLVTDPYSGVACLLQDSRVHGILKGQNQAFCSLAYVPNGEEVKVGQKVFTSGEDQVYPKGLPVGEVVEARPGPEFQQVTVRPLAPLNRLEEVLVILKPDLVKLEVPVASVDGNGQSPLEEPSSVQSPVGSSPPPVSTAPAAPPPAPARTTARTPSRAETPPQAAPPSAMETSPPAEIPSPVVTPAVVTPSPGEAPSPPEAAPAESQQLASP
jgi:rod shape-determining protein MreC